MPTPYIHRIALNPINIFLKCAFEVKPMISISNLIISLYCAIENEI